MEGLGVVNREMVPETVPQKRPNLWSVIQGDVPQRQVGELSVESEFELYLNANMNLHDPLQWWKQNSSQYPRLSILARKYLRNTCKVNTF